MSKIICDVCGTSYPETADQCPICGCVRPADIQGVLESEDSTQLRSGYTYVKGGRFSKANVKKRIMANPSAYYDDNTADEEPEDDRPRGNMGLIITALVLLLAIVAVILYITLRFFGTDVSKPQQTQPVHTTGVTTAATTEPYIPCTGLTTTNQSITFDKIGAAWLLNISVEPADTTDQISYASADESVATVSAEGKVTAVGQGSTVITVTCGDQTLECQVICEAAEATEEATQPSTEDTTAPEYTQEDLHLNRNDITFAYEGETWNVYSGAIPADQITWTSENPQVVTIENGVIKAVGNGKTTVYGKYGELEVSCIVRCRFASQDSGIAGSDDVSEDG